MRRPGWPRGGTGKGLASEVARFGESQASAACGASPGGVAGYAPRMYLSQIVLDAHAPRDLALFWASLLGGTADEREPGAVHVAPPGLPLLVFRPVQESGAGSRCHLFLGVEAPDLQAVRARANALGVTVPSMPANGGKGSVTSLRDPEGNELCLVQVPSAGVRPPAAEGGGPVAVAKARVVFTDARGRVLLVRLRALVSGRHWGLPGGTVEAGSETPRQAAVREIAEELDLSCAPGRLLSVDWVNRVDAPPRMVHVFDGGRLEARDLDRIRLDQAELAEWGMYAPSEAEELLSPAAWGQLKESLAVQVLGGGPAELVDGVPTGS